jgi:hypothetical protein
MTPRLWHRTIVTRVRGAGPIHFATVRDFGARSIYAWAGFDCDLGYRNGRSIVIDFIPDAPRADQVATAVRANSRVMNAIDRTFVALHRALADSPSLRLPIEEAIAHVDVIHAIVVVDTPIPRTRLEREHVSGDRLWIELMSQVTYASLDHPSETRERRRIQVAHERDARRRIASPPRLASHA